MANLGATFDATTVDPATGFELFPVGKYVVQIVGSEMRATKDGGGQYLWLELDVLEGPLAGRKLFDRLNLVNASAQTVEIAQRTLSAICHATGRLQVQDSAELHLIPIIADVTIKPPKNGYGESNKVALPAARARRRCWRSRDRRRPPPRPHPPSPPPRQHRPPGSPPLPGSVRPDRRPRTTARASSPGPTRSRPRNLIEAPHDRPERR